jgi:hypothetical protein
MTNMMQKPVEGGGEEEEEKKRRRGGREEHGDRKLVMAMVKAGLDLECSE